MSSESSTDTSDAPAELSSAAERVLAGGGEMGELIRSIRWADTALAPVESWSPALRTLVGLLLRNRFPVIILWGPISSSVT